jgi:hypothetical protein
LNAQDRLHEARIAAREGRYEDALAGYIWFHKNALEDEPSLYGVRLSFALGYWADLGEEYPPAREALLAMRDQSASKLVRGVDDRDLFHDVVRINENLKQIEATTELFLKILERSPEFAANCSRLAMPSLVVAGHYDLARQYLADPGNALGQLAASLNKALIRAKSKTETRFQKIGRWAHLRNFIDDARLILSIVRHTDGAQSENILRDGVLKQVCDGNARRSLRKYVSEGEIKRMPPPRGCD